MADYGRSDSVRESKDVVKANLVSVIVPTYNRSTRVLQAIRSVLTQTHACVEVVVVDDGSTDDTEQRVAAEAAADQRVRYFRQPNSGVSAARNRGLAEARGEYLAFLDSDDTWKPWKLQFQLDCLASLPDSVGMIWTDMDSVDEAGRLRCRGYIRKMYSTYEAYPSSDALFAEHRYMPAPPAADVDVASNIFVGYGNIYRAMLSGNLVHTSTVLLRRSRQRAVGDFDTALKRSGEDFDFHLRTCRAGSVAFADICSINYTTGAADQLTTRRYGIDLARNFLATVNKAIQSDGDECPLSQPALNRILSKATAWYGSELVDAGDGKAGRRLLLQSLRLHWANWSASRELIRSWLPRSVLFFRRQTMQSVRCALAILWSSWE